jgi:geranylgeranyl pyrophosphate synthase
VGDILKLSQIYQPIKNDLEKVENEFRDLALVKQKSFPELYEMINHILGGGKVVRPALTLLSQRCFSYDSLIALPMATATELLHIATLIHDDAIDKADSRRGRATINRLWGLEKAILMGDYLFAKAGEYAAATGNLEVVRLFSQTLQHLSTAELGQSFSSFDFNQTFDNYLNRIGGKTASLMSLATESGAILGGATKKQQHAFRDFGFNLGIAFQMVDDILDFIGDEREMGKPVGSDLRQGLLTLPSILWLEKHPKDTYIARIFNGENVTRNINIFIQALKESGIFEEAYDFVKDYSKKAIKKLSVIDQNKPISSLRALTEYLIARHI